MSAPFSADTLRVLSIHVEGYRSVPPFDVNFPHPQCVGAYSDQVARVTNSIEYLSRAMPWTNGVGAPGTRKYTFRYLQEDSWLKYTVEVDNGHFLFEELVRRPLKSLRRPLEPDAVAAAFQGLADSKLKMYCGRQSTVFRSDADGVRFGAELKSPRRSGLFLNHESSILSNMLRRREPFSQGLLAHWISALSYASGTYLSNEYDEHMRSYMEYMPEVSALLPKLRLGYTELSWVPLQSFEQRNAPEILLSFDKGSSPLDLRFMHAAVRSSIFALARLVRLQQFYPNVRHCLVLDDDALNDATRAGWRDLSGEMGFDTLHLGSSLDPQDTNLVRPASGWWEARTHA